MKITITIDIPEDRLPELLRLARDAGPEADPPPSTPHPPRPRAHRPEDDRDEPENVQQDPPRRPSGGGGADGPVRSGKQLLGWLRKQPRETFKRAVGLARSWGYGEILVDLADDEAAAIHRELTSKPEGRQKWGG